MDLLEEGPAQLVADLIAAEIRSKQDCDAALIDGWGNPIVFKVDKASRLISLVSSGANRVFENGKGDDVLVEIRLPVREPPVIFHRFLTPSGEEKTFVIHP
jgi:hypothetical protein